MTEIKGIVNLIKNEMPVVQITVLIILPHLVTFPVEYHTYKGNKWNILDTNHHFIKHKDTQESIIGYILKRELLNSLLIEHSQSQ